MFEGIGRKFDKHWATALTFVGGFVLTMLATFPDWFRDNLGTTATFVVGAVAAALTASGPLLMEFNANATAERLRLDAVEVRSELMTAVRATIVPLANEFIALPAEIDEPQFVDVVTTVTLHCRAFATRPDATSDSNYYQLDADTLTRVNRAAGRARPKFEKSRRTDERSLEESAVVSRIQHAQHVLCSDTQDENERRRLSLAGGSRRYRSFASVPVLDGEGAPIGMLSLNSTKEGALNDLTVEYLWAVSEMLTGLQQKKQK